MISEVFFMNMLDKKAADIITTININKHKNTAISNYQPMNTAAASCAINSPEQNWFSFKEISVQAY